MYTEGVKKAIERLRADIDALRELHGSRKYEVLLTGLETDLDTFLEACEDSVRALTEEEESERDAFDLRHRRLVGLSEEITALGRKRPEQPCNPFKARQVNQVLKPLKEELEAFLGETLSLVDEDGVHTYSDVSLLVRNYLDLSAAYAFRRYGLRYYERKQ